MQGHKVHWKVLSSSNQVKLKFVCKDNSSSTLLKQKEVSNQGAMHLEIVFAMQKKK